MTGCQLTLMWTVIQMLSYINCCLGSNDDPKFIFCPKDDYLLINYLDFMYKTYCTVFDKCHQELQYQVVLELKYINILFNTFVDFESYGITYLYHLYALIFYFEGYCSSLMI